MSDRCVGCGHAENGGILLAAINAKWIHPSLALRLLKANLGPLENRCAIIEFALRQPLSEKIDPILAARPHILGLSVSIWNHAATLELLKELRELWERNEGAAGHKRSGCSRPWVVLGGPEVSNLPPETEIFRYADYVIRGEGESAFRTLCEAIFGDGNVNSAPGIAENTRWEEKNVFSESGENFSTIFIDRGSEPENLKTIKSAYHLYTDEDLRGKLVYAEASRGCPYGCEFCLSASSKLREFELEPFLAEMDGLVRRGAGTFKFLDRSFNINIDRARSIMEFFLNAIEARKSAPGFRRPLVVHFEMIPSRFPPELIDTLARFPPGTLRLEIGIQTLNPEVSARVGRPQEPERELANLRLLREKTNAIIHADLIAGLPGEDLASFGKGFDLLLASLFSKNVTDTVEIQLGILKLLPGAAIARHSSDFGMRYNLSPLYEIIETAAIPAGDLDRIKNFARFWELIVNRGLASPEVFLQQGQPSVFDRFMALSDSLLTRFGRNWGIAKNELLEAFFDNISRPKPQ